MSLRHCLIGMLCAAVWLAAQGMAAAAGTGASESAPSLVYQGFTYPYPREPGSYLFIDGAVYPYVHVTDHLLGDSTVRLPDGSEISARHLLSTLGLARLVGERLEPVVGYGSNPAPSQLSRKYAADISSGDAVIPVMKGYLSGYDVTWTPVFVDYGAMPATITPSPGTRVDIWVTWLPDSLVAQMSRTEHVGVHLYALATLTKADYAFDGPDPAPLKLYVSCFGALTIDGRTLAVAAVPALHRRFRAMTSSQALAAVAPTIGWRGSVLDLLYANVSDPQGRARRSDKLRPLGLIANDPGMTGMASCKGSRTGLEQPY